MPHFKASEKLTLVTDFSGKTFFDPFIAEQIEATGKDLLERTSVLRLEDKKLLWQHLTGIIPWQWVIWQHFWWPRRGTLGPSWAS